MIFSYRAIDTNAQLILGLREATSVAQVRAFLAKDPLVVLSIRKHRWSWTVSKKILFWEGLVQLHEAGYKIHESLEMLTTTLPVARLKMLSREMYQRVIGGLSLAEASEQYPSFFNPLERKLLSLCERTGEFLPVFRDILAQLRQQKKQQERMTAALSYPLMILIVLGFVFGFYEIHLLPEMDHFNQMAHPLVPQSLGPESGMGGSIFLGLLAGAPLLLLLRQVRQGLLDRLCQIQKIGLFFAPHDLRPWLKAMSVMLRHHVHLLVALEIANTLLPRPRLRKMFATVAHDVEGGLALSEALVHNMKMIPDLYVSQMKMAERSGSYGAAFDYLEGVVEKMTSDRQERFLKFLGPCSMLAVGGCMVLMVLRCLGPLYEMIQGVS